MNYVITIASVLLTIHYGVQGRPEQMLHPPMVSQHELIMEVPPTNATEVDSSSSHEATTESMDSVEDENITVQAKASPICPPRMTNIVEIEKECMMEDKMKETECTSPAPVTDTDISYNMTESSTAVAEETSVAVTENPVENVTMKHGRRHRKRTCNYHLCILRRLDVLDSSDMPDRYMLMNWAASNITDEEQQKKTQQKLDECIATLKDIFTEMTDTSKSTEEEVKSDETSMNKKKKSCGAAKKVISCLSKSTECPVVKF